MSKSGKRARGMAEILRKTIRDRGETVADVARATGVAQPVLHRFMAGERSLRLETADKLAAYCKLGLLPLALAKGKT
ncbi:MAG TPA: helix-turn-helix transcriptional regulator [Gemmataceae bacterium]|jgi:plasmid maintenance system antidote protein VapI|nr:helix-turn-helix transcriptional regulator [Gemmataceae bacterium]